MNWVEDFAWLLILGGVLVFLLATYFGGVLHGRRAAAREDERQRALALAIEEERRSEEREAAKQRAFDHIPLLWSADLTEFIRPFEVDGQTDRRYVREDWT